MTIGEIIALTALCVSLLSTIVGAVWAIRSAISSMAGRVAGEIEKVRQEVSAATERSDEGRRRLYNHISKELGELWNFLRAEMRHVDGTYVRVPDLEVLKERVGRLEDKLDGRQGK